MKLNKILTGEWIANHIKMFPPSKDLKFIEYVLHLEELEAQRQHYQSIIDDLAHNKLISQDVRVLGLTMEQIAELKNFYEAQTGDSPYDIADNP